MSENHKILNGNGGEGNVTTESRRGSQALQSPIKSLFSSLTQRTQKTNGSVENENNASNNDNMSAPTVAAGSETALKNGLFQRCKDETVNESFPRQNEDRGGGLDIKIQQLQQSPIKSIQLNGIKQLPYGIGTNDGSLQQHMLVQDNDRTISVRIEGEPPQTGFFGSPRKRGRRITGDSCSTISSVRQKRRQTSVEREMQQRIDRENRILLRKILEQHHGVRRNSIIPPPPRQPAKKRFSVSRDEALQRHRTKPTSNQVNQQRWKHKTDYENLLLLQKIQNAKPSKDIEQSFQRMKL